MIFLASIVVTGSNKMDTLGRREKSAGTLGFI